MGASERPRAADPQRAGLPRHGPHLCGCRRPQVIKPHQLWGPASRGLPARQPPLTPCGVTCGASAVCPTPRTLGGAPAGLTARALGLFRHFRPFPLAHPCTRAPVSPPPEPWSSRIMSCRFPLLAGLLQPRQRGLPQTAAGHTTAPAVSAAAGPGARNLFRPA